MAGPAAATAPKAPASPPASPAEPDRSGFDAARTAAAQAQSPSPPAGANENEPGTSPPPAQARPATPERGRAIADWADRESDHSGGFLGIGGTDSNEKVRDALAGKSELGALSVDEKRVLADRMIDRWDAGRGDGPSGPSRLVEALGDAPADRAVVGQQLAARSAAITKATPLDPNKPDANWESRGRATSYARSAVEAAGRADDPASAGRLRETVQRLGPEAAGNFARALTGSSPLGGIGGGRDGLSRTLAALDGGEPSEARSAFVQNAFSAARSDDFARNPELGRAMGTALAREWHPDDPDAAARDADRLTGILGTDQGQRLLGDNGGQDGPSLDTRVNALATLRADPSISGEVLRGTDDPWTNPAVIMPGAQAGARQYLDNRGDAPMALAGSDLDNTVGTAMGLPPSVPAGTAPADAEARAARGAFSFYGSGDAAAPVKAVADQIRGIAGEAPANVTVLPVTYSDGKAGPVQVPLFRVTDPSGAERYVDNTGRRYDDFEDWRTENKLPPGTQVYPEGGHLTAGPDGKVALGQGNTPETVDSFGERVGSVVDKAALVGGIVAGGVLIVGTGGLATPAVLAGAGAVAAGAGAWGAYRSGSQLVDRSEHGQSLNPITDGEARGLWLNLGASVAAVGAFGSAARLGQLGQAGRTVAPLEASLHGYTQAGAFALDTAAVANQGIDTARHWDRMSAGDRASSILQMGFWGVGAGVGMRASGIRNPGDMFNPIAIRDSVLASHAPGVAADPTLQGDAVKIDYDPATGIVQGIRHGPDATPGDIALHQRTAQNIQRSLTLEGQIGRIFAGGDAPPPGTVGWAARADIAKVTERLQTRSAELDAAGLTPQRRSEIEAANAVDRAHLDDLAGEVSSFARDPANATIDAKNSKRKRVDGTAPPAKRSGYDIEAERAKLPVGETTRTVGGNTVTYYVNDKHNPTQVDLFLTEIPPSKKRSSAENTMTAEVGKSGGRPRTTREERDNGGHIAGFQFLHEQGLINQFPQNEDFNQRVFNEIDGEVRQWVEQGAEVHTRFTLGDGDTPDTRVWGGKRPSRVTVEYEVTDPKTGEVIYKQPVTEFKNEAGQEFDGYRDGLVEQAGNPKAKVDVGARMREALGLE